MNEETPPVPAYLQRLTDEKAALDAKVDGLRAFFGNPAFEAVAPEEQSRLRRQFVVMHEYQRLLGERLAFATS